MFSASITFGPVTTADFDSLVALRIAAMRESLERVGRFDPERARERLRKTFYPEHTQFIVLEGERIGFYTFRPMAFIWIICISIRRANRAAWVHS